MNAVVTSSPGKSILFGDHGVHRGQPNIVTTVDLRTYCRVTPRDDDGYSFRSGQHYETGTRAELVEIKARIDALRAARALDEIAAHAHTFYGPSRYVMASILARAGNPPFGLDVEWKTNMPTGSGLGSGAAAFTAMAMGALCIYGVEFTPEDIIHLSWQGDVIAHGGYGSSLDSSTIVLSGLIEYSLENKAQQMPFQVSLPLVIGDTLVEHSTAKVNTHIRLWLESNPARMHVFNDMGYLRAPFIKALREHDLKNLGHLMNLHQLLQEKMGTSLPEIENLIEAALGAGAYGAKISGSGGGGVIIALAEPGREQEIAAAIDAAGGRSYIVKTDVPGTRVEPASAWDEA
jgi:mevalonate kinase